MEWDSSNPISSNQYMMPEFNLKEVDTFSTVVCYEERTSRMALASSAHGHGAAETSYEYLDGDWTSSKGIHCENQLPSSAGRNFSTVVVSFLLERELGSYFLDYYIPSILLVFMSWVSFWLHPTAVPGRTTLGKKEK